MKSITIKKSIALFLFASSLTTIQAQDGSSLTMVSWNKQPAVHQVVDKYQNESAVILFDSRRIEYIDNGDKLEQYRTLHKLIHINDDRGIEAFNKIYLDVSDNADIRDIKARTILPGGRIIEIDKNNIKDIQEKDRSYKIFAMEGVQKGCEIEFYYTYKVPVNYFGRETLQGSFPVVKSGVEIVAPERLVFEIKPFNDIEKATDTVKDKKRIVSVSGENIAAAEDEKYSAYSSMLKRIEYKLSYNNSRNDDVRLFTWNELAKLLYASYSSLGDNELKKAGDLAKREGWEKLASDTDKIIQVESFVKSNYSYRNDVSGEAVESVDKIIKNRIASAKGMMRLYSGIFTKLGIKHEYVICGSREDYELDKSFENWDNADNVLIYFPAVQKYICPTRIEMRFPWIYFDWASTNALFCKPTVIGNFSTAVGVIKPLPVESFERTQHNLDVNIRFNESIDTLLITTENSMTGYSSIYMRFSFNYNSKEEQESFLKEIIKSDTKSENIVSSGVRNVELDNFRHNTPFIIDAKVKSVELIERAGKKTLIKIGEIIGDQAEIYEDKPRQFPIHIQYPHIMNRRITLEIPEGYTILNANDLNIKSVFEDNGEQTMGFVSTYKIDKNQLIVDVVEDYRKVYYPLSQYAPFQKIINAAADFNKIILVMEKK